MSAHLRALRPCALLALAACGQDQQPDPSYLRRELDYYMPDPEIGHLHRPNALRNITWAEHPNGGFVMRTNDMGFREDASTLAKKSPGSVRVLFCGDSHLDGVLDNAESLPNVLEALLADETPGRYELINGGVGYYGPYEYARFLERYVSLEPDAFVVAFYGGNDFLNASKQVHQSRPDGRDRPRGYLVALERAKEQCGRAVVQALNQVYYTKHLPVLAEATRDAVHAHFTRMQELCRENGVELFVVLWPSLMDAQPALDRENWQKAADALELSEEDLALNRKLVVDLEKWLGERGIPYLDLYEPMKAASEPCFWLADYHINVYGQKLTAERVLEAFGERLGGL